MRYRFIAFLVTWATLQLLAPATHAQSGCEGTSGSALINGSPWSSLCVIAATASECIDSTGAEFECFQIIGVDSVGTYSSVAIFLAQPPVQGLIYDLGGESANGAMVLGNAGLWLTSSTHTGSVQITLYDPGSATIDCNFEFEAQHLFGGPDLSVTDGSFHGYLVGVEPRTWTGVKELYRR